MSEAPLPPRIRTDESNAFALRTMKIRLPAIIRETADSNPDYPDAIRDRLYALAEAVETNAPIPVCQPDHPYSDEWATAYAAHKGETWLGSEWLFAEPFLYRHLIDAVDWWTTRRDPFAPKKREEEASPSLWLTLERALSLNPDDAEARLMGLLEANLWGNKADLSYKVGMGFDQSDEDWLCDERAAIVAHLMAQDGAGTVHLITDNYGTELATDFALIDGLLDGVVENVIMHVKAHPTYVSDTTQEDALNFLTLLSEERRPIFKSLGDRLAQARMEGRLSIQPDFIWNSPYGLMHMPAAVHDTLRNGVLIISKGDANYRRLIDDRTYPADTLFADVLAYAPAPICAIRTMKSDAVIGLQPGQAEQLYRIDYEWRTNGRRGLIQFAKP